MTSQQDARTTLLFRQATSGDAPAARAAYQQIIDHLAATVNYPYWYSESHPTPGEVSRWAASGELHLAVISAGARCGEIAGVVVINHDAPPAYGDVPWSIEAAGADVLVLHALGVVPGLMRTGVARFLVDATLDVARARGCRTIRLDTYVKNTPARELYTRYGFTDLGAHTISYEGVDIDQFELFDYVL